MENVESMYTNRLGILRFALILKMFSSTIKIKALY